MGCNDEDFEDLVAPQKDESVVGPDKKRDEGLQDLDACQKEELCTYLQIE